MAEEADPSSKTEDPSQRRLDDARRKGDVVKSADVPAFAALAAASAVLLMSGGGIATQLAATLEPFIAHPDAFDFEGTGGVAVMRLALNAALPAAVVMLAAAAAGAAGNLIQHGLIWSPSKLAPDPSKLSPIAGFKRLFGADGLFNFGKSLLKLIAISAVTWMVLKPRTTTFQELASLSPAAILPFSLELLRAIIIAVLTLLAVTAGADWLYQRQRFMQRMRMSREEMKQEHKDSDGDPHLKAKLKSLRIQRSRQRMIQAVPTATVVIVNPTHYAVALRYEQGKDAAPTCVAKGVDAAALRIRAVAEENDVPLVEDPPLARTLYAAMDVDQSIPREHYEAVAKVIGFVLNGAKPKIGGARPR